MTAIPTVNKQTGSLFYHFNIHHQGFISILFIPHTSWKHAVDKSQRI